VVMGKVRAARVERKTYTDGMESSDEEEAHFEPSLDADYLFETKVYPPYFIKTLSGDEVNVEFFQRAGLKNPIRVLEKTGLHMRMPDGKFSITDVKNLVGGRRLLEVMNSATQANAEMTLKDWEEFFVDPDRDGTKLNCISLEFSNTKMDQMVVCPRVVRQVDFTDNVWPRHLKEAQEDPTNDVMKMCYPKVQKYCLMSIGGCYTDFHVDLGGTSVWYHLLKGQKVFWLIPPTPANLKAFEQWTMSGKQSHVFFGDLVPRCSRVTLVPGNTFFIPSGWIHAVYTPEDSLVVGGNFLHPYAIERQLRIAQCEETLKVPHKYRFPFFTEMLWYVLDKYCYALLGRHHIEVDPVMKVKLFGSEEERKVFQDKIGHPHLTPEEVRGLKSIVLYLHSLPGNKKNVPALIKDPVSLIRDIRIIVEVHKNDTLERATNGRQLLYWPGIKSDPIIGYTNLRKRKVEKKLPPAQRIEADGMKVLKKDVLCKICRLDGWWVETYMDVERSARECELVECVACHEVVHPTCVHDIGIDGIVERREGISNIWTCPSCVAKPSRSEEKVELNFKQEQVINEEPSPNYQTVEPAKLVNSSIETITVKEEPVEHEEVLETAELEESSEVKSEAVELEEPMEIPVSVAESEPAPIPVIPKVEPPKMILEPDSPSMDIMPTAKVVVCLSRIGHVVPAVRESLNIYQSRGLYNLAEIPLLIVPCLLHLPTLSLHICRQVSRSWCQAVSMVPAFNVDLTGEKLTSHLLSTVARKQPPGLKLDRTGASKQQLGWLLPKLPNATSLSLIGLESSAVVAAFNFSSGPSLTSLDLGSVTSLSDFSICLLLRPKEGKKSNWANLSTLRLSSTDITDISLRYIGQYLPSLTYLDISSCMKLTNAGLVQLGDPDLPICSILRSLDLRSCVSITDLVHLLRCSSLSRIKFSGSGITDENAQNYAQNSGKSIKLYQGHVIAQAIL